MGKWILGPVKIQQEIETNMLVAHFVFHSTSYFKVRFIFNFLESVRSEAKLVITQTDFRC